MNALQDKIRELDAERDDLKNENLLLRQTLTVIRTYLNNAKPEIKTFEIIHDLKGILSTCQEKLDYDLEKHYKAKFVLDAKRDYLIDKQIKEIMKTIKEHLE